MQTILDKFPDDLKKIRILIQEPGRSNIIRLVVTMLDNALRMVIRDTTSNNKNFRRQRYIYSKMIFIVDSIPLNTIFIRGNMSNVSRGKYTQFDNDNTNVAFCCPATFDYWNLPEKSFDVLFSNYPVRTEYLTDDALIFPFN